MPRGVEGPSKQFLLPSLRPGRRDVSPTALEALQAASR